MGLGGLACVILGRVGRIILEAALLISIYAVLTVYITISMSSISSWFAAAHVGVSGFGPRVLVTLVYAILPIGLAVPRNFAFLSPVSYISVGAVLFFAAVMIIKCSIGLRHEGKAESVAVAGFGSVIFQALAIYALAFALADSIIPLTQLYKPKFRNGTLSLGSPWWRRFLWPTAR